MLKAKLVALCVCPAVLAPPAIVAVHRPTRHAVAHLLQRAAHRLDNGVPAASPAPAQYANIPCAPTFADTAGTGVPTIGGVGLATLLPPDGAIYGDASRAGSGSGGGGGFFLGGGGGGAGGGGGGGVPGATSGAILTPVTTAPTDTAGGVIGAPPSVGGTMGSVPEPGTWALLVIGFGVVGVGLRYKRVFIA